MKDFDLVARTATTTRVHVAIVGAGLSGLSAGIELTSLGHSVQIFEANENPGGRVQSTNLDGHIIDAGFQILLTEYPQAKYFLDYDELNLQEFSPGALVWVGDSFHRVSDPLRDPKGILDTIKAPVGSVLDKAKLLKFKRHVTRGTLPELWSRSESTALESFKKFGFSDAMIESFLRPLFAGVTLDSDLQGSSRVVEFVYRMMATGKAAVPAEGMGEISEQLASYLPADALVLGAPVEAVSKTSVSVGGEAYDADAVVVATDRKQAQSWLPEIKDTGWKGATSIWFKAPERPITEPVLILNAGSTSPINSAAVMSNVSSAYSPNAKSAATVVATAPFITEGSIAAMAEQLRSWFGAVVETWEILEVQEIAMAQPKIPIGHRRTGYILTSNGIWACGDYLSDSSINGALESGRLTAQAIVGSS